MKSLIGILVLAGVILGGYFLWQKPATETTLTTEDPIAEEVAEETGMPEGATMEDGTVDPPITATIRYTDTGYQPAVVTIKQGQIVRWVNDSKDETWPASAVHPTHGIYPQKNPNDCLGSSFDSCRGLASGEAWDFTFDAKGTWRFHDHLHPSKTGSVIVE